MQACAVKREACMAKYGFEDMNSDVRSINAYRNALAERDQHRAKIDLGNLPKNLEKSLERSVRSAVKQDEIGREVREVTKLVSAVSAITIGAALVVASAAVETKHNQDIRNAQDDFRKMNDNLSRTEDRANLRQENEKNYLEERSQKSTERYETAKDKINKSYEDQVEKIKASHVGSEREKLLERAETTKQKQLESVTQKYESQQNKISNQLKMSDESTKLTVANVQQSLEANKRYAPVIDNADSMSKMTGLGLAGQKEKNFARAINNVHSEIGYDLVQTLGSTKDADLVRRVREDQKNAQAVSANEKAVKSAQKEVDVAQKELSSLIKRSGSDDAIAAAKEKLTVASAKLDKELATSSKLALYVPQASKYEKEQANAIINKYAGNISSEKDVKITIANLTKSEQALAGKNNMLAKELNETNSALKANNSNIANLEKELADLKKASIDPAVLKAKTDKMNAAEASMNKATRERDALKAKLSGAMGDKNEAVSALSKMKSDKANHVPVDKSARAAQLEKLRASEKGQEKLKEQLHAKNAKVAQKTRSFESSKKEVEAAMLAGKNKDLIEAKTKELAQLKEKNNALKNKANKLNKDIATNQKLMVGIKNHSDFLKKHGKAIADVNRKGGGSKAASAMQKRGIAMILGSTAVISRDLKRELHKGNAVHKELMTTARNLSRVGKAYENAIIISSVATKLLTKPAGAIVKLGSKSIKVVGGNTRLGKKLSEMKGKFSMFKKNFAANQKHTTKFLSGVKGAPKKIIMLPGKLLSSPMAIITAPERLAKKALTGVVNGTFRFTRKATGLVAQKTFGVVKAGGRLAGKGIRFGINKTLGKTKWYQKASARANIIAKRLQDMKKALAAKIASPAKKIKNFIVSKIIVPIAAAISAVISFIGSVILFIIGTALWFILMLVMIIAAISFFTSIFGAIAEWWDSLQADNKALIKNDPQFIVNHAVNYRNAELDIYELFYQARYDADLIRVNESPIYYALYDNNFHWFGITGEEKLSNTNEGVQDAIKKKIFNEKENNFNKLGSFEFEIKNKNYYSTKLSYYSASDLAVYSDGSYKQVYRGGQYQYVLKNGAVPSKYELSNAKDALALVDTIYTNKTETMQKTEVLAYLGVGKYQLGQSTGEDAYCANNNLFWETHKIIYNSGNQGSDIWYHVTNLNDINNIYLDSNYKYVKNSDGSFRHDYIDNANPCDNHKEITIKYTDTSLTKDHVDIGKYEKYRKEKNKDGSYKNVEKCFDASYAIYDGSLNRQMNASEIFYYSQSSDSGMGIGDSMTVDGQTIYFIAQNCISDTSGDLFERFKPYSGKTIHFYWKEDNSYYAADDEGNYYGIVNLNKEYKNLKKQITEFTVQVNNKKHTYKTNLCNNDEIAFGYFNLTFWWNENDQCYRSYFDFFAYENDVSKTNDMKHIKTTRPAFAVNSVRNTCGHYSSKDTEIKRTIQICQGHIDLDVAFVVTTTKDINSANNNNMFFESAMKVPAIEEDTPVGSFLWMTYDKTTGIFALGADLVHFKFHPYEDWAESSSYRELALTKVKNDIAYTVSADDRVDKLSMWIYHYTGAGISDDKKKSFKSLNKSSNNNLLYGMTFNNTTYYVESFISGPQKDLIGYSYVDGSIVDKRYLDFCITSYGTQSIRGHYTLP